MLGIVVLLLVGLALLWIAAVIMVAHGLRHPARKTYAWAISKQLPTSPAEITPAPVAWEQWEHTLAGRNAQLSRTFDVWDIRGNKEQGPVAIITPGWADSKWVALDRVPVLMPHCSRILLWDPPGLGETHGACTLGATEFHHLVALVNEALEPKDRVVLFGWSMGAGIGIAAAAELGQTDQTKVLGVIAEAPYINPQTPAINVLRRRELPGRLLAWGALPLAGVLGGIGPRWRGFDRRTLAAKIRCPLLVLHGSDDEICPLTDGRVIANAAPQGSMVVIPQGMHMDLWTSEPHCAAASSAVTAFLRSLLSAEELQ